MTTAARHDPIAVHGFKVLVFAVGDVLFSIPVSIRLSLIGLAAHFRSLSHDQYEFPVGDVARVLTALDEPTHLATMEKIYG